jgi:hypothetical protein
MPVEGSVGRCQPEHRRGTPCTTSVRVRPNGASALPLGRWNRSDAMLPLANWKRQAGRIQDVVGARRDARAWLARRGLARAGPHGWLVSRASEASRPGSPLSSTAAGCCGPSPPVPPPARISCGVQRCGCPRRRDLEGLGSPRGMDLGAATPQEHRRPAPLARVLRRPRQANLNKSGKPITTRVAHAAKTGA